MQILRAREVNALLSNLLSLCRFGSWDGVRYATNGAEGWGMVFGQFDQEMADKKALENCSRNTHGQGRCSVVARTK